LTIKFNKSCIRELLGVILGSENLLLSCYSTTSFIGNFIIQLIQRIFSLIELQLLPELLHQSIFRENG